jgi:hypothetical protein
VTCYGLDSPGIESGLGGGGARFSAPPQKGPSVQCLPGLFPRVKAAGAWHWPPPASSAEVKDRLELYLYCPPWPIMASRVNFAYYYYYSLITEIRHCLIKAFSQWKIDGISRIPTEHFKPVWQVNKLNYVVKIIIVCEYPCNAKNGQL